MLKKRTAAHFLCGSWCVVKENLKGLPVFSTALFLDTKMTMCYNLVTLGLEKDII